MKKVIYATAAETGGAISILKQFYIDLKSSDIQALFLVSLASIESSENTEVLKIPRIKKNRIYRLWFYLIKLPRIIKIYNPDEIISLNNILVPFVKTKQILYLHQPLPFADYKICLLKNPHLWAVKNILGFFIKRSVRKAHEIMVQSNWFKKTLVEDFFINPNKISIKIPQSSKLFEGYYKIDKSAQKIKFIFPSGYIKYKNHQWIVDAVIALEPNIRKYIEIKFTLKGDESKSVMKMYKMIQENRLPINFVGYLNSFELHKQYISHSLIFPSQVETFGLPLQEAKEYNSPILCFDGPFAREILNRYSRVNYFKSKIELEVILKKLTMKHIQRINS